MEEQHLQTLIDFLENPEPDNVTKWFELDARDNLLLKSSPTLLALHWQQITKNFAHIHLLGQRLLRSHGKYQLGEDLPSIAEQISIKHDFDFAANAQLLLSRYGGNTKQSTCDFH